MANIKTALTSRLASAGDGDETITVGFMPKYVDFYAVDDLDPTRFSRGTASMEDIIYCVCIRDDGTPGPSMDLINSIHIETYNPSGPGDGWTAIISGVDSTGFTISWTKLNAGKDVTVHMTAMG